MLTPPVMCSQQLFVFHWINNFWYQKFTSQIFTLSLLFKNYSLVEVPYLFIRFNKTKFFPWNTKNIDKNDVINKTYTCTPNTQSKIILKRLVSMKMSDTFPFQNNPLFFQTLPFYEKNLNLQHFWENFENFETLLGK